MALSSYIHEVLADKDTSRSGIVVATGIFEHLTEFQPSGWLSVFDRSRMDEKDRRAYDSISQADVISEDDLAAVEGWLVSSLVRTSSVDGVIGFVKQVSKFGNKYSPTMVPRDVELLQHRFSIGKAEEVYQHMTEVDNETEVDMNSLDGLEPEVEKKMDPVKTPETWKPMEWAWGLATLVLVKAMSALITSSRQGRFQDLRRIFVNENGWSTQTACSLRL